MSFLSSNPTRIVTILISTIFPVIKNVSWLIPDFVGVGVIVSSGALVIVGVGLSKICVGVGSS